MPYRPQLYVCGELFSGSDEKDVEYVLNLAFNGLIREAMQAPHTSELSRNVYMYVVKPCSVCCTVSLL